VDELGRRTDGRRPGDLAFAWAIVRALAEKRGRLESQLEIEGHGRGVCAFVANGRPYTYAGPVPLPIARDAVFGRGLDLVAPVEVAPASLPSVAVRVFSGRAGGRRFLREHDLDRIEIRCDVPLPLQVDGEDLGDVEHGTFEAERGAVSVLA
jgi:diacylglycerol kinase family enzyme